MGVGAHGRGPYLQYENVRPDYVTKLWDLVDWTDVRARYTAASAAVVG